ncbi:22017_t:CDS:2 [Racocetra persica]|uniref:22017_t:CDS:1 n=1 Tax=Racocetra persica TaxID=160502 RepID=A0ACA9MCN0_9GLOM|nr:22017_t:CDS:2 [Racocetra persica]
MAENIHPKALQIPSISGLANRIQEIINELYEDNKKLKAENEINTKENLEYEETLKNLNNQINITLNIFKLSYNINDKIEKKIELVVEDAKTYKEIGYV